jgi:hypothetical protein
MIKFRWEVLVVISIVIVIIFAFASLLFKTTPGTFTDVEQELVPDSAYLPAYAKNMGDVKRFESEGERISRACLENVFNLPFSNVRLDSIQNSNTGKNLELDCYNEHLKLALEYHGVNHYKFIPFFHKTVEKFNDSLERDRYKLEMCNKLGIDLIIVPYNTKHENICDFINRELKKLGKTKISWDLRQ